MSRVFQSSIFRALCAIIVGALLVKYREQTVTGITITIGAIFLASGLFSIIAYFFARRHQSDVQVFDAQGQPLTQPTPTFPILGIGSAVLGIILACIPNTFVEALMYILAAILILGALNQYFNLFAARKWAVIGLVWWIMPTVILAIGILTIIKPTFLATAPLFVIGWAMMVYGAIDLVNAIKLHNCRKAFERNMAAEEAAANVAIEEAAQTATAEEPEQTDQQPTA